MRYSITFKVWWDENKNSESLADGYRNYRLDNDTTDEKPASFKRWAFENVFHEN